MIKKYHYGIERCCYSNGNSVHIWCSIDSSRESKELFIKHFPDYFVVSQYRVSLQDFSNILYWEEVPLFVIKNGTNLKIIN